MKYSENYGFALPTADDDTLADIGEISLNFETVDRVMKKNEDLGTELNRFEAETMDAVGRLNTRDADLQSQIDTKATRKVAVVRGDPGDRSYWYKVASGTIENNRNISLLFAVYSTHIHGDYSGILQLYLRGDYEVIASGENLKLGWLVRAGFDLSQVILAVDGYNWELYYRDSDFHYPFSVFFEVIQESDVYGYEATYNLHTVSEGVEFPPLVTAVSTDLGTVNTANKLTTARNINGIAFDGSADINITANDIPSTSGNGETLYDMIVDLTARIEALENSAS